MKPPIFSLFLLSLLVVKTPFSYAMELDNERLSSKKTLQMPSLAHNFAEIAVTYGQEGNKIEAAFYYKKAADHTKEKAEKTKYLIQAASLYGSLHEKGRESQILKEIAFCKNGEKQSGFAERTGRVAHLLYLAVPQEELSDSVKDDTKTAHDGQSMAEAYAHAAAYATSNPEKATYFLKSASLYAAVGDVAHEAAAYDSAAACSEDRAKAKEFSLKAASLYEKIGDDVSFSHAVEAYDKAIFLSADPKQKETYSFKKAELLKKISAYSMPIYIQSGEYKNDQ